MKQEYLDQMQAHLDEGVRLSHRNEIDLFHALKALRDEIGRPDLTEDDQELERNHIVNNPDTDCVQSVLQIVDKAINDTRLLLTRLEGARIIIMENTKDHGESSGVGGQDTRHRECPPKRGWLGPRPRSVRPTYLPPHG